MGSGSADGIEGALITRESEVVLVVVVVRAEFVPAAVIMLVVV